MTSTQNKDTTARNIARKMVESGSAPPPHRITRSMCRHNADLNEKIKTLSGLERVKAETTLTLIPYIYSAIEEIYESMYERTEIDASKLASMQMMESLKSCH